MLTEVRLAPVLQAALKAASTIQPAELLNVGLLVWSAETLLSFSTSNTLSSALAHVVKHQQKAHLT
jgi:hypothetical protein